MGNVNSSNNHAMWMEEFGANAIIQDGRGGREEDELAEGAVRGIFGISSSTAGKYVQTVDDTRLISADTEGYLNHMTTSLNAMTARLQKQGKIGMDKSSTQAIKKRVAQINRISQQGMLRALTLN